MVGGGVNPSPREEGKGEVGSYQDTTLNHLSPGAGGISLFKENIYIFVENLILVLRKLLKPI